MRILIVAGATPLPTNPARGTFVADHARLLRTAGHEVRILNALPWMRPFQEARRSTLTGVARAPSHFRHEDVDVDVVRYLGFPEQTFPALTRLSVRRAARMSRRRLGDWAPDHVISHTIWPVALVAEHLAREAGVPWTIVVHGWDADVGMHHTLIRGHVARLAHRASSLVCVTEGLTQPFRSVGIEAVVIPCHLAVPEERRQPIRRYRGRWRQDRLDLVFPGDPRRPEKNYQLFLETGRELERRGWQVHHTTFMQQPREVVWDRLSTLDAMIMTSTREGGPLLPREAIALGMPVASVDVGDLRTWLPPSCVSIPVPESLADSLECAISADGMVSPLPSEFEPISVKYRWDELLGEATPA